jgi:uncharacterized protein (DUF1697 family)
VGVARYVAFLRAINVAGHGRVTMDAVRDRFTAVGCGNVRTIIQSGNVLFESPQRTSARIVKLARGKLRDVLGEEPEILLRSVEEIEGILKQAPFQAFEAEPETKLYVVFLAQQPRKKILFPLVSAKEALEAVGMNDREVFVVSRRKSNGFFGFPNAFVEEAFKTSATSRNWSTVTRIVEFVRSPAAG